MMFRNRRVKVHNWAIFTIFVLLLAFLTSPNNVQGLESTISNLSTGPYVDEVIFKVIVDPGQTVLALRTGEIEMDTGFIHPYYFPQVDTDPDIDIFRTFRNGYGHITINCAKYPLNISGLRRAFAFAFDKTRFTEEIMDGFSIEHDSLVPLPNGWCAEEQFDYHYYTAQPDIGNQILDDLNFTIDAETGFRLAPNGTPFEINIEYGSPEYSKALIGVDALNSLHINASTRSADFNEYISRLDSHGDYDMVFYEVNFYSNDVDWLAYEYWSENADTPYQNPTNFRNATYDNWRDQLLYGTSYEAVFEAAAEMQKILQYNVPRLVVYENTYMQAYRNDKFTGHVEDLGRYISGPWTMRKIHNLDGSFGGTIPIAVGIGFNSFNIFLTVSSGSAKFASLISDNLYSSLFKQGPDFNPQPDLAESMLIETHSDNPAVPDGHTRFTIDIIQNATWSDGTPLTAYDVAFTYIYQYESAAYGNPVGTNLEDFMASYAPNQYRVILEFKTESYWHFSDFAFDYIIPHHIFNNSGGIGYEEWNTWNPVFDVTDPHVTCGPYLFSDFDAGEFYRLEPNPLFHYAPINDNTLTNTTTTTTSGTTNQTAMPEINWSQAISFGVGGFSSIVILYCSVHIFHERRSLKSK